MLIPILLKRELWEHRTTFLYLPAAMAAAIVGILILITFALQTGIQMHVNVEGDWSGTDEFGRTEEHHYKSDTIPLDAMLGSKLIQLSEMRSAQTKEASAKLAPAGYW